MRVIVLFILALAVAQTSAAQSTERVLTPLEVVVACAAPPTLDVPADRLTIIGGQDTVRRGVLATADQLVIDGGTDKGIQLGQQYYVRRPIITGPDRIHPRGIVTAGWLRVVAVNEKTAIAKLDHFCGAVYTGDYLEPFTAPSVPAEYEQDTASTPGELQFEALGRIISGMENMSSGAGGSLMLIDRGTDQDTQAGMRFAVYRDVRSAGVPLAAVGEGVVLAAGKTMSLTKITRSRDAIITGDYVVPRK